MRPLAVATGVGLTWQWQCSDKSGDDTIATACFTNADECGAVDDKDARAKSEQGLVNGTMRCRMPKDESFTPL